MRRESCSSIHHSNRRNPWLCKTSLDMLLGKTLMTCQMNIAFELAIEGFWSPWCWCLRVVGNDSWECVQKDNVIVDVNGSMNHLLKDKYEQLSWGFETLTNNAIKFSISGLYDEWPTSSTAFALIYYLLHLQNNCQEIPAQKCRLCPSFWCKGL